MSVWVLGLGVLRFWGVGFRVEGLGVLGFGFLGIRVSCLTFGI